MLFILSCLPKIIYVYIIIYIEMSVKGGWYFWFRVKSRAQALYQGQQAKYVYFLPILLILFHNLLSFWQRLWTWTCGQPNAMKGVILAILRGKLKCFHWKSLSLSLQPHYKLYLYWYKYPHSTSICWMEYSISHLVYCIHDKRVPFFYLPWWDDLFIYISSNMCAGKICHSFP